MIAIATRPLSGRKWGTISFASTLHLCPILDLLLTEIPNQCRGEIRLGLQEALVNAAKHGNKLDPNKKVLVQFFVVEGHYWWIIADQGSGFAPSYSYEINCHNEDIQNVEECGRGLYILHQVFDEVQWNEEGTELRLSKQIRHLSRLPLFR
ncbi:MAG TPA: ATP-binding protein [Elainellaceae cyanobacterium]